jgi:hypothetical protein
MADKIDAVPAENPNPREHVQLNRSNWVLAAISGVLIVLTVAVAVLGYEVYLLKSADNLTDEGFVEYMRDCVRHESEDRCRERWRWMEPSTRWARYTEAGKQAMREYDEKQRADDARREAECRARGEEHDMIRCEIRLRAEGWRPVEKKQTE